MLIRMCAWHPKWHGYPKLLGFAREWRGWRLTTSHGICRACGLRLRGLAVRPTLVHELVGAALAIGCVVAYSVLALLYVGLATGGRP